MASRMYTTSTAKARLRRIDTKRSIPVFPGPVDPNPFQPLQQKTHKCPAGWAEAGRPVPARRKWAAGYRPGCPAVLLRRKCGRSGKTSGWPPQSPRRRLPRGDVRPEFPLFHICGTDFLTPSARSPCRSERPDSAPAPGLRTPSGTPPPAGGSGRCRRWAPCGRTALPLSCRRQDRQQ